MIRLSRSPDPVSFRYHRGSRDYQEDSFGILTRGNRLLLGISDGMGGHSSGELASRWLIENLHRAFQKDLDIGPLIRETLNMTQEKIQSSGKDMGCTAVMVLIEREENRHQVSYTWIGDSRVYVFSGSGLRPPGNARKIGSRDNRVLWLITEDDSFVWGFLSSNELSLDDLTLHPNKNQLELSIHSNRPDIAVIAEKRIRSLTLHSRDRLLLCTDGVWETFVHQEEIISILSHPDPAKKMNEHLKRTQREDLLRDNNTCIISTLGEEIYSVKNWINKKKVKP